MRPFGERDINSPSPYHSLRPDSGPPGFRSTQSTARSDSSPVEPGSWICLFDCRFACFACVGVGSVYPRLAFGVRFLFCLGAIGNPLQNFFRAPGRHQSFLGVASVRARLTESALGSLHLQHPTPSCHPSSSGVYGLLCVGAIPRKIFS